jgi:aminoglycoside 3-N-acetyltransferase
MSGNQGRARHDFAAELTALGVRPRQDLLVHCSMRRLGPVPGGPSALLDALRAVAGPHATLVVPAHTADNSLSSPAFREATAGLDCAQRARFIEAMPGFDPLVTPSTGMGVFAEYLRTHPEAVRSSHPQTSFAALGPRAEECTAGHALACHLGEQSPLGWLYQQDAAILLLGVGYAACTALHLAEYRLAGRPRYRTYECFTVSNGRRGYQAFQDIDLIDADFMVLGERIDREPFVRRGRVGAADCRLLPLRQAVDFAAAWLPFRHYRSMS